MHFLFFCSFFFFSLIHFPGTDLLLIPLLLFSVVIWRSRKMLQLGAIVDVEEVSKIHSVVDELRTAKLNLEKELSYLNKEKDESVSRVFSLLTEKYELTTECDSLSDNVKRLQAEVSDLKASTDAVKAELIEKENSWIAEKTTLVAK